MTIGTGCEEALLATARRGAEACRRRNPCPELKATLEDLKRVLRQVSTPRWSAKDAPAQQQLREALQEITRAAQGVSGLTEYLERKPQKPFFEESTGETMMKRPSDTSSLPAYSLPSYCGVRVVCADRVFIR
ncbi:MAG: hypothetical protein MZV70_10810 [Desulfobacterales bacterium]|nr:hypothetical protein [Desulfobacterales bacterium]